MTMYDSRLCKLRQALLAVQFVYFLWEGLFLHWVKVSPLLFAFRSTWWGARWVQQPQRQHGEASRGAHRHLRQRVCVPPGQENKPAAWPPPARGARLRPQQVRTVLHYVLSAFAVISVTCQGKVKRYTFASNKNIPNIMLASFYD